MALVGEDDVLDGYIFLPCSGDDFIAFNLQHARVAVAPLRIARGVQNKVLEAMAMGLAVVATPAACTGIGASAPPCALATDDPALFAARVVAVLADTSAAVGRSYVDAHHDWRRNLVRLADLLEAA